jgi:hypothetical protein
VPLIGHPEASFFEAVRISHRRHPEASFFEAVRISSFNYFKKILNEIATSPKTLLAMTEQQIIQIPLTPFSKGGNDS